MAANAGPVTAAQSQAPINAAVWPSQQDGGLLLVLDASESLVAATPFLPWKPEPAAQANAAPTVVLPLSSHCGFIAAVARSQACLSYLL